MKKASLILNLMHEIGVSLKDLLEASKCFSENHFSLMLFINEKTMTDDPEFFETNPSALPKGVIINNVVYPFLDGLEDSKIDPLDRYKSYSRTKKRGTVFPSIEELKPLAEKFAEYKAIAGYFNLKPFEGCVIENEEKNSDFWVHFYNLVENKKETTSGSCPYFEIKKLP